MAISPSTKYMKYIRRVVNLDGGPLSETLPPTFFNNEYNAHTFLIELRREGKRLNITYSSPQNVTGRFLNANDQTVVISSGEYIYSEADDITAIAISLPHGCYDVEGRFTLTLSFNSAVVYKCQGYIERRSSNTGYDPDGEIENLDELVARISEMRAATTLAQNAAAAATTVAENVDIDVTEGTNSATITITRPDGTQKTQTINVTTDDASSDLIYDERLLNNGQYVVTVTDMENGGWSYSSKINNTKRVRNRNLIPVSAGMQIAYSTPTLRLGFWVLASKTATGSFAQIIGFQDAGSAGTLNITADGYLIILADSANNITVADYDCKVTILSALDSSVDTLKDYNAYDVFAGKIQKANSTMAGITFTWDDNTCIVNGTSTGTAVSILTGATVDLPSDMMKGGKYYVKYKATDRTNMYLRFIFYDENNTSVSTQTFTADSVVTIPSNAAKWNVAIVVPSPAGKTINNAVISDIRLLNTKSNFEMADEIEDISSLIRKNNVYDIIAEKFPKVSTSMAGITFTWDGDICTVNGTSTGAAVNILFASLTLPEDVVPGGTYFVKYNATNITDISLRMIFYDSNDAATTFYFVGDREITVPDSAVKWNVALYVPTGRTINNAVVSDIKLLNAKTNKELTDEIEGSLLSRYYPENSTFSVWNMPRNSWWGGPKEPFEDSVAIKSELFSNVTYQVLNIGGFVYLIAPVRKQAYFGQMRTIDSRQYWMAVNEAVATRGMIPDNTDIDTLVDNGIYVLQSGFTYANAPGFAGTLIVFKASTNIILQLAFSLLGACKVRTAVAATFSRPWADISGGGGGTVYNNTYVSQDYRNTYNITCSPQITTDTNNFLASTDDTTDRTGEIQAMLNSIGICRLGPGDFYVTGVQVPTRGMLIGSGNATSLVLDESVATGYAVKLTSYSSVKNLRIRGTESQSAVAHPSEVGNRHGIIYESTYPTSGYTGYYRPMIDGCTIYNFSGGGITLNSTGISAAGHVVISNCIIYSCGAGINIHRYSEFHRITNVTAQGCLYGCIDNGGNNNFANCDFSSNENGLLIDNSTGQSPNNTHGSFVGCTFNHTGGNTGIAIRILGGTAGEIFTASQIFFGGIVIDGSIGVRFIGANIGRNVPITISNSKGTTFTDCNLREAAPSEQFPLTDSPISVTNSSVTRFEHCIFEYPSKHQVAANSGNTVFEFEKCFLFNGTVFDPLA